MSDEMIPSFVGVIPTPGEVVLISQETKDVADGEIILTLTVDQARALASVLTSAASAAERMLKDPELRRH